VTAAGSNTFTSYDNNGNLLLGGGRSLTWDANNLVTQVVMGGSTTTFTYGPDGDRIKKTSSSTTLKYPFGDDYEINGTTVTKYFNAGFGVIAKKVGTTLYWLHADRLGSINATTDGSGAEVLRRSYRSYGELLGQTGTHTESLGYIGQRTDSETGLTYLHARYYDSQLGMFLSPDPIGADSHTYRYSAGDPINGLDPSGLDEDCPYGSDNEPHCKTSTTVYACGDPRLTPGQQAECDYRQAQAAEFEGLANGSWSDNFWQTLNQETNYYKPRGNGVHYYFLRPAVVVPPVVTPTPTPSPSPTPTETPKGPGAEPSHAPGSGNEPCRAAGNCTANDLGLATPPPIPPISISSPGCPSFPDQFVANQRYWDSLIMDKRVQATYAFVSTVDDAKGLYNVNRTLGRAALGVAAEAYLGLKVVTAQFLGGAAMGNGLRAVWDFAVCTPR